jgi:hypothetical protein
MEHAMKMFAKIGAIAALGLGLAFTSQAIAGADTAPQAVNAASISVTPATGLSDGAAVAVSGTGLQAGVVYHIGECVQVGPTSLACNPGTNIDVTANAGGAASTPLSVNRAFTGVTHEGTTHSVDCTVDNCVIAFFSDSFDGGLVPISFN